MKVCSLYGAGFYYIPGTDICMKIGGYVRYQLNTNTASITAGPFANANNNRNADQDFAQRVRAIATFDTRQQTAYGTLRTYLLMGYTYDSGSALMPGGASGVTGLYMTRGFIQIAGFTFGRATSFFDFVSTAAVAYNAGYTYTSDTGDPGQEVGAYTAQFGNGVSATVSVENAGNRNFGVTNLTGGGGIAQIWTPALFNLTTPGGAVAATGLTSPIPDFVANLRIDQAWGSAQIAGAIHEVAASYYTPASEFSGHPSNKTGWAISPGIRINAPMFGPGDYFQAQYVYAEGAGKYAGFTPTGASGAQGYYSGNSYAFGASTDALFTGATAATGTQLQLTTSWSVFASYEHFWTPALRTSIYGSYYDVSYNNTAKQAFCAAAATTLATTGAGGLGCSPSFSVWNIGTRSQWNVTKDFYVGVDVIYDKFNSASYGTNAAGVLFLPAGAGGHPTTQYTNSDQDVISVTWRAHRDIVP